MNDLLTNSWAITIMGGIAVFLFGYFFTKFFKRKKESSKTKESVRGWKSGSIEDSNNNHIVNTDVANGNSNVNINIHDRSDNKEKHDNKTDINSLKKIIKILFIDDDISFKIIKILKSQGWINTKIVTDVVNLDKLVDIHIFFVDINGVGKKMQLEHEGMDLALYLKNKYPNKRVVLYSTDTNRDVSHDVFNAVDYILPKDAQVYQFTNLIEQYSKEIEL